jgi:Rad3-related DNA helicase
MQDRAAAARSTSASRQLVLVRGLPDPSVEKQAFERRSIELLKRYIERTDGHAFVLFTSYSSLRQAAAELTRGWRLRIWPFTARPTARPGRR